MTRNQALKQALKLVDQNIKADVDIRRNVKHRIQSDRLSNHIVGFIVASAMTNYQLLTENDIAFIRVIASKFVMHEQNL